MGLVRRLAGAIGRRAWFALRGFSLLGKLVALAASTFLLALLAQRLGLRGVAREFDRYAFLLAGIAVAVAVILHIWTRFTRPSRYGGWTRR